MRKALLLSLCFAACSPPPSDPAVSLDELTPLLEQARATRLALEKSEAFIAAHMPAPAERLAWQTTLVEVRLALNVARDREESLSLLAE